MTQDKPRVGFIGLGLMGRPMATNLIQAGFDVIAYNRTPAKADPLISLGATRAASVTEVFSSVTAGIIIICVTDTPSLLDVVGQAVQTSLSGTLIIDMGTTTVEATQQAASRITDAGGVYVDAPVSGGAVGAAEGTLSIMAGGDASDIARAQPIFDVLGKATTHIGPIGSGQIAKSANQAIVGATLGIVSEAMLIAKATGADQSKMRAALLGGFAQSRILDLHGQRMIDKDFTPGGRATTQAKDMVQAVDLARSYDLNLPILELCSDLWKEMAKDGKGDLDQSGFYKFLLDRHHI